MKPKSKDIAKQLGVSQRHARRLIQNHDSRTLPYTPPHPNEELRQLIKKLDWAYTFARFHVMGKVDQRPELQPVEDLLVKQIFPALQKIHKLIGYEEGEEGNED